jgi:hypothetical protein
VTNPKSFRFHICDKTWRSAQKITGHKKAVVVLARVLQWRSNIPFPEFIITRVLQWQSNIPHFQNFSALFALLTSSRLEERAAYIFWIQTACASTGTVTEDIFIIAME